MAAEMTAEKHGRNGTHRNVAERRYPSPKVRGGDRDCQDLTVQERPRGPHVRGQEQKLR